MAGSAERLLRGKVPGGETGIEVRPSVCTICDPTTQCGLDVYVRDGRIVKVEGTAENPHNAGTLCGKGAATRQYVYHPDRLRTPLRRVGPRGEASFEPIGWDEALDGVVAGLRKARERTGPESVVFYAGYTKWMRPFLHRLASAFGSPNYCTESSTCFQAMAMAWKLTFGMPAGPDLARTRCVLVWSQNPFYTNTTMAARLLDMKERGIPFIVVDPRYSPMAAMADIHLQPRPGTDGALALAMAHVILTEDLYDRDFVDGYTHGFAQFKEYVAGITPAEGERLTGVPAAEIVKAARLYAGARPAALVPSASPVVHHTNGVQNYRAIFSLVALTGNYDVAGGNLVQPASWLYVSAGFRTREHEFTQPRPLSGLPPRVGQDRFPVWSRLVDEGQSIHLPFQILSGEPYPLTAMVAFGINHRMWPDSGHMARALASLDFLVDVDLFLTDTCRFADIVLPACSSVERSEFRCYPERWALLSQPAIEPLYESRSDADIIFELARRLGLEDPLFDAGYESSLDWILEPSGLTVDRLKDHPAGMPVPDPLPPVERSYVTGGFPTPSGRMEFASGLLAEYAGSHGYEALPVYHPPRYSPEAAPQIAADYPLILNTGSRLPMFVHSRTFRVPWNRMLRPRAAADIHPADAARLGVEQGDRIRIATPSGSIEVDANLTGSGLPGVVHMYHGYAEADVNTLFEPDYQDPISGFPGYKSALCRVDRVASDRSGVAQAPPGAATAASDDGGKEG